MKHILYIILIFVIGLTSCKKSDRFTIKANLADYQHDYLFAVYDDPVSKVDTIYPQRKVRIRNCSRYHKHVPSALSRR